MGLEVGAHYERSCLSYGLLTPVSAPSSKTGRDSEKGCMIEIFYVKGKPKKVFFKLEHFERCGFIH